MFHQLHFLAVLLAHLLTVLLTTPVSTDRAPVRLGRVVVGTLREAEVVLDLAESEGATERVVATLPGGSFAVRWR